MPFASQWFANPGGPAYEIDQSCRFNDGDSSYLTRTPGSAGNRRTWTLSVWVKRAHIASGDKNFFNAGPSGSGSDQETEFKFYDSSIGNIRIYDYGGGAYNWDLVTDRVFRDPASWYNLVFKMDTTQGTPADRFVIYANGETVAVSSRGGEDIYPDENFETAICDDVAHMIGKFSGANIQYFDGYLAEMHLVDGTALTAASFGKTDSATGQWIPIEYTGSYGTTGFYLAFQDSSSLGDDTSGNGNDWTSSGLVAADQTPDSPTLNRAVLNGIQDGSPTTAVMSEGNTRVAVSGSTRIQRMATIPLVGKVYWEVAVADNSQNTAGICDNTVFPMEYNDFVDSLSPTHIMGFDNANLWYNSSSTTYSQPSNGQRWMFAFDADTGEFWSGVNGTWHNSGDPAAGSGEVGTVSTVTTWFMFVGGKSGADQQLILGSGNMSHTVPSGFTADLDVSQLADPTTADPSAYFQTTLYTGNGSTQSVDQSGNKSFEPDLVWIKNRDATDSNILTDSVRGVTKVISSDATTAETTDADTLTAFESNGFALGDDDKVNTNTEKFVAWQWLESATSGFDIVSFTGNATNRNISHSLGVIPEFIIVKNLADTDNWAVYHAGNTAAPATDYLILNANSTTTDDATIWNDTAPTSSVFSVGTSALTNGNTEAMIAYVFAPVAGFSAFGSYTGNANANGPMINCGFRPDWVMIKEADTSARDWIIQDAARNPYNVANLQLLANSNAAEATTFYSQSAEIDIVSNGFKVRSSTVRVSENDAKYVYAAFAHAPFKTANAR